MQNSKDRFSHDAAHINIYIAVINEKNIDIITPTLYNTIIKTQGNFRVSYPILAISRVKMYSYIAKSVPNDHLGSSTDSCYITKNKYPKLCYNEPCYVRYNYIYMN